MAKGGPPPPPGEPFATTLDKNLCIITGWQYIVYMYMCANYIFVWPGVILSTYWLMMNDADARHRCLQPTFFTGV
jgi:hypothetical protein